MGLHKRNREISWRKKKGALTFIREILKVRRFPLKSEVTIYEMSVIYFTIFASMLELWGAVTEQI